MSLVLNSKIKFFTDLNAWKEAHLLVLMIYKESKKFPQSELFSLTNQIRRAAVSITSNIAEGFSRFSFKEKIHFYYIARGSLTEVQNQLIIAKDLEYIQDYQNIFQQTISVHRLLNGLIAKSKSQL